MSYHVRDGFEVTPVQDQHGSPMSGASSAGSFTHVASSRPSRALRSNSSSTRSRSPGRTKHGQEEGGKKRSTDILTSARAGGVHVWTQTDIACVHGTLSTDLSKEREELERERAALESEKEDWSRQRELFINAMHNRGDPIITMRRRDRLWPCMRRIFCFWRIDPDPEPLRHAETNLVSVGRDVPTLPLWGAAENARGSNDLDFHMQVDSISDHVRNGLVRSRSGSYSSFHSTRSTSRALSSAIDNNSARRLHSRSLSQSNRVNAGAEPSTGSSGPGLGYHSSGDPLEVLRQTVTDTLSKFSLSRDLEDPLIQLMVKQPQDARSNAAIKEELIRSQSSFQSTVLAKFTPLMFRDLIYAVVTVLNPLRETELNKLIEIFENQWLIKVLPGANKLIDGRRSFDVYEPIDIAYQYQGRASHMEPYPLFRLADVIEKDRRNHKPAGEGVLWAQRILELIEGLLRSLFDILPAREGETLRQYRNRIDMLQDSRDWRSYWRQNYSNSRLRLEVFGFVVGKLVDVKMKGSPAMLYPQTMVDVVFGDSTVAVEDFLLDLRIVMRLLDLLT